MKKFVVTALVVLGTVPAFAKVTSSVSATSNFIWRGLSLTGNTPAVQGGFNYIHDSGVVAGVFASNQALFGAGLGDATPWEGGASGLAAPYLVYGKDMGDINVTGMLLYYTFSPSAANRNSLEYIVKVSTMGATLALNYLPNFFGTESSDLYANLSYTIGLDKNFGLALSLGSTTFGDEKKTPVSSYMDWKAAFQIASGDGFATEVGVTGTSGLKNTAKVDLSYSQKSYVSFSKSF